MELFAEINIIHVIHYGPIASNGCSLFYFIRMMIQTNNPKWSLDTLIKGLFEEDNALNNSPEVREWIFDTIHRNGPKWFGFELITSRYNTSLIVNRCLFHFCGSQWKRGNTTTIDIFHSLFNRWLKWLKNRKIASFTWISVGVLLLNIEFNRPI